MFVDGYAYGVLVAGVYFLYHLDDMGLGCEEVAARFDVAGEPPQPGDGVESGVVGDAVVGVEGVDQCGVVGSGRDVDAQGFVDAKVLFANQEECRANDEENGGSDDDEDYMFLFHNAEGSRMS